MNCVQIVLCREHKLHLTTTGKKHINASLSAFTNRAFLSSVNPYICPDKFQLSVLFITWLNASIQSLRQCDSLQSHLSRDWFVFVPVEDEFLVCLT